MNIVKIALQYYKSGYCPLPTMKNKPTLLEKLIEHKINKGIKANEEKAQLEKVVPEGWEVLSWKKLLKMKIPEVEFLIEGLIPSAGITIIAGDSGSGKSWLMLEIAKIVGSIQDQKLFNEFVVRDFKNEKNKSLERKVLYIDEEAGLSEVQRRIKMLNFLPLTQIDFKVMQGFKIDNEEERKKLMDICQDRNYKLVIFDSLIAVHSQNENDSQSAQAIIDCFKEFTRRGITILIVHHNRKENFLASNKPEQILRGSSAWLGGIDSLLAVKKTNENPLEIVVIHSKLRQGRKKAPAFKIRMNEKDEKISWEYICAIEDEFTKKANAREKIKKLTTEKEMTQTEIIKVLIPQNIGNTTIRNVIKDLKDEGKFEQSDGGSNKVLLRWKE